MSAKRTTRVTKQEIFNVALRIIDEEGVDALSMRRLAKEVGIEAMSLYHHVANKQAVLAGAVEVALTAQQATGEPVAGDWKTVVTSAVCGFRQALVKHPNILPLVIANPPSSPEANAMYIEMPLRFLVDQGFEHEDAGKLFEAVFAMSFGHAMLSTSYKRIPGVNDVPTVEFTEESFAENVRILLDGYDGRRSKSGA